MKFIGKPTFLAVDLGISEMSRRARALSFTVDNTALGIETTHAMLQTGVSTNSRFATLLVGLAVIVVMTLELVALFGGFALEAVGAQTYCPMI